MVVLMAYSYKILLSQYLAENLEKRNTVCYLVKPSSDGLLRGRMTSRKESVSYQKSILILLRMFPRETGNFPHGSVLGKGLFNMESVVKGLSMPEKIFILYAKPHHDHMFYTFGSCQLIITYSTV